MEDLNKIFNAARELAHMLLETEEGKAMTDARYIYDGNQEAQTMLEEYSLYRNAVQERMQNGELSNEELEAENEVMAQKVQALQENKVISDLFMAEQRFNHIINHVMTVFNATLSGQEDSCGSCGGGCSSCSGCH